MVMDRIRTYTELMQLPTFKERFEYLKLDGRIGEDTFGPYSRRWMNQNFYKSIEWARIKRQIVIRDNACDLAIPEYEIPNKVKIIIHHMNPITQEDIINKSKYLLDPEYLITTVKKTHDAIHYGNRKDLYPEPVERYKNDMCPWIH